MNYLAAHWGIISVTAGLVINEALPYLPTKYQSIGHIVLDVAGKLADVAKAKTQKPPAA